MKKLLRVTATSIAILCMAGSVQAQLIPKGTAVFGGNGAYQPVLGLQSVIIQPNLGFVVADNLVVGAFLEASLLGLKPDFEVTSYNGGPFARYYRDSGLFSTAELDIRSADGRHHAYANFGIGFARFVRPGIAIEPVAQYAIPLGAGDGHFSSGVSVQLYLGRL